ncbi:hypothetical protein SLE2022_332420 [Rubroshorea leprosula]
MVEKKRKFRGGRGGGESKSKKKFRSHGNSKANGRKRTGPRLPFSLRKELDRINPRNSPNSDDEINSDEGDDVYEYEEGVPEEESRKNRRYDPVENYEYELPEKFKDENVPSDDDDDYGGGDGRGEGSDHLSDGVEEEDEEKHARMLQGITGMPREAFGGKKKKNNIVISEAYPESEYNPSRDVLDGDGRITVQDLLDPLQGKSGFSKLRKRVQHVEEKSTSIQAPLPKPDRERLERKAVYEQSKKDITKWEPLIKRNREAPTVYFDEDVDVGFSTVGAIASEFEPRTEFEKKIASLVYDDKIMEAHKADGSKLLELNKISMEDYMKERNHIAKMRGLLFHHEMKKKLIKKIKSKTYHRLMKRDKLKVAEQMLMDPETAKEQARKQEFKRAEERMTLKHKNKSKWARRILERGLSTQDEGTRAAMAEQLNQHALLTRKMNTMKDSSSSSSDSSSDEDDDNSADSDRDRKSELLAKAREKTLKVLEEGDEVPKSGVLSLPFMVRGLEKRKQEALEEAKLALQDYEQLEGADGTVNSKSGIVSGRRVFGGAKIGALELNNKMKTDNNEMKIDNYYGNEDSEDDLGAKENFNVSTGMKSDAKKNVHGVEDAKNNQNSVFKNFEDIVKDPGPKTTYDVAIFASGTWKKMNSGNEVDTDIKKSPKIADPITHDQDLQKEVGKESDSDSEGQMVDGILSSGAKDSYELPSQAELIRHAFAGDDVEEEFEKDKQEILNEENPEPEKPVFLPGWGQWTHIQQKRGLPSWMLKEHDDAKRKREEALKKRKDAHLKHVIISEKLDKKAEKLQTKTLPYPFTSKEVFEQSMRMPIGPEFNPVSAIGALNRPEVVKRSGVIIKPIKFEEVNQQEKPGNHTRSGQKHRNNKKSKGAAGKMKK